LYPDARVGHITVVFARIAGAEGALTGERLQALPSWLEARKREVAQRLIHIPRRAGMSTAPPESVVQGISFAVETDASPTDYKR
jgi:membrane protein required for beta-lactamase induction